MYFINLIRFLRFINERKKNYKIKEYNNKIIMLNKYAGK